MGLKTALVLSAGGMFGAYQAGVWKALARRFQPDLIVGASVGALNAWAISGGADPEELIARWLDPGGAHLAAIRLSRRPWRGVFDSGPLEARIEDLWKAYRPRMEIGIVAVELRTLRPRLFRNSEITRRHLAASCAVFACYPQVRLGTRLYTDGGLLESLPLWAAAAMDAQRIIAVNALAQAPSRLVRGAVEGIRAVAPRPPAAPSSAEILSIVPSRPLGGLRDALFWNEAAVKRSIALGEADCEMATREARGWP